MWRVDSGTFYDLKIPALLFYSMMNEEIVIEAKNDNLNGPTLSLKSAPSSDPLPHSTRPHITRYTIHIHP